jgi:hypothetical protein
MLRQIIGIRATLSGDNEGSCNGDTSFYGVLFQLYSSGGTFIATMFNYTSGADWTVTQNGITVTRTVTYDLDTDYYSAHIRASGTYTGAFSGYDNQTLKVRVGIKRSRGAYATFSSGTG